MPRILAFSAYLLAAATTVYAQTPRAAQPIARFPLESSGLAATGPARVHGIIEDEGDYAFVRGYESGPFDVYARGVRIAHDIRLEFRVPTSSEAIDGSTVAKSVITRPEGVTIIYSHSTFTVREHLFVPLRAVGAIALIEVATVQPLAIKIKGAAEQTLDIDSASAATFFFPLVFAANDSTGRYLLQHVHELWQEKVAHFRKLRSDAASADMPDARLAQALDWAKVTLDRRSAPENVFAAIDLGQLEAARQQLINANVTGTLAGLPWVRACYAYWLASGDESFVRAYWSTIARAVRLAVDSSDAASQVALEGAQVMARALRDNTVLRRAADQTAQLQQQLDTAADSLSMRAAQAAAFGLLDAERAELRLERIGAGALTADWGMRLLPRDAPTYDPLRWDRGAVSTYMTGITALAHYRYHRAWAGFDLLRDIAHATFDFTRGATPPLLSGAYYQVLDAPVPAGLNTPAAYVAAIMHGLIGWEVDAPHRAAALEPHMPADWTQFSASALRLGHDRLDVTFARTDGVYSIGIHRLTAGGPLALRVAPALPLGARVDRIMVNDADVPVQSEESAHDVHAVAELTLTGDAQIEVHYQGGMDVVAPPEHVDVGEISHELKIIDFRRDQREYLLTVEGVGGTAYSLQLRTPWRVRSVQGSDGFDQSGDRVTVRITLDGAGVVTQTLRVRL